MVRVCAQRFGETFPFGTLGRKCCTAPFSSVILSGLLMHMSNSNIAIALQQLLVIGVCGGLTTFSSFSLQTFNLIAEGRWLAALSNIVFSTGLSFGSVALGWQITQGIQHLSRREVAPATGKQPRTGEKGRRRGITVRTVIRTSESGQGRGPRDRRWRDSLSRAHRLTGNR